MVIGIGCDLVSHSITKELGWESDPNVLNRIFTPREIEQYEKTKSVSFLAGRFGVKEAVLKCIKTGMEDGISLLDIEVLRHSDGQAKIEVHGKVKEATKSLGIRNWKVSISHTDNLSMVFVLAQ